MTIHFSTSNVHPRDAVCYWTDVVTRTFYNSMEPHETAAPFEASLRTGELGFLNVISHDSSPYLGARTRKEIALTDDSHYFVCLQLTGTSVHSEAEREVTLRPGTFFLLDGSRPFLGNVKESSRQVVVKLPREKIDAQFGDTRELTTRAFNGQNPISALMFGFLSMLPARVDTLKGAPAFKIADQAVDLLVLALTTEMRADNKSASAHRATTLTMLKLAVDTHLRDPAFKPAAAAAAAGISIRYANTLLAEEGTCLERYIITRRLAQCKKALQDLTQAHRTISEIAFSWGFSDISHFSRRFKAAFGCTPGEYRKARELHEQLV